MKRRLQGCVVLAVLAGCFSAAHGQYDYFRNIRYPGQRRADVSLDRIEQARGPDAADGYNRRVVHWWPKKGVDIVVFPKGQGKDYRKQIRYLRSAARNHLAPKFPVGILGFRIVLRLELRKSKNMPFPCFTSQRELNHVDGSDRYT